MKELFQPLCILNAVQYAIQNISRQLRLFFDKLHEFLAFVWKHPHALLKLHKTRALENAPYFISQDGILFRNIEYGNAPLTVPLPPLQHFPRLIRCVSEGASAAYSDGEALPSRPYEFQFNEALNSQATTIPVHCTLARKLEHTARRAGGQKIPIQHIAKRQLKQEFTLYAAELSFAAVRPWCSPRFSWPSFIPAFHKIYHPS